jgi:DNA-binding response OmpR family regulator
LVDLLKLLMENPGVPFSKEDLAKKLWNQKYNPAIHDNTIYVTIKRIRSLIEPNPHHSKYILRSRSGYLLNQDSKVLIQNKEPL